jgi:hypothetical protein
VHCSAVQTEKRSASIPRLKSALQGIAGCRLQFFDTRGRSQRLSLQVIYSDAGQMLMFLELHDPPLDCASRVRFQ